jgi:hypothetical protein
MKEEEGLNSIAYSKNVIELITVANEFCSFIEKAENFNTYDFLSRLQKILPLLYLKASLLPDFDFEPEDELEKFVTEIDYNLIQQKILRHTASADDYPEVFVSGMQYSETALTSSISENIADIYQEMKDFVLLFRLLDQAVMEQAVWECKYNFEQDWGQTLVNCLRAVHQLVYTEKNDDEQDILNELNKKDRTPDWLNDRFLSHDE